MPKLYACHYGAKFSTKHTSDWTHCEDCGAHGKHECPGPIDQVARKERARAFVAQELKRGQPWTGKRYEYEGVQS